jgi:transcriptional regulator with XRE-family HTH domain
MELSEIGRTIRKARQAQGLTQERLAAKAGISRATLNGLETGMVGELGFRRLAAILGILGYELAPASTLRPGRSGRSRRSPGRSKPLRNASARGILRKMARRYIWWQSTEASMRNPRRVIAQVMDVGTLEDIQQLAATIGKRRMVEVLDHARPAWFHPKSWSFWHTALEQASPGRIPPIPARRRDALPDPA